MRVFLTGASGAIGTRLVPQLIDRGHDVIGTSTSTGSAERVRALIHHHLLNNSVGMRVAVNTANVETISTMPD